MPRKGGVSKKELGGGCVGPGGSLEPNASRANSTKCSGDEKKLVKNVYIGASNAVRWNFIKNKLSYESDVDLVRYLLDLAEPVVNGAATTEEEIKVKVDLEPESNASESSALRSGTVDTPEFEDDAVQDQQDWQSISDPLSVLRRSPRKPSAKAHIRRSARNHKHHRRRKHRKTATHKEPFEDVDDQQQQGEQTPVHDPAPQLVAAPSEADEEEEEEEVAVAKKEDNHKHHHDKHKGTDPISSSRMKRKRKKKEKLFTEQQIPKKTEEKDGKEGEDLSQDTTELPPPLPKEEPIFEPPPTKHRKRHKRREKYSHDVSKAPEDGLPVLEKPSLPPPSPSPHLLPPTLELPSPVDENSHSQTDLPEVKINSSSGAAPPQLSPMPDLAREAPTTTSSSSSQPEEEESSSMAVQLSVIKPPMSPEEPLVPATPQDPPQQQQQRVAIRIKLCGDCGSRHVQDACPLLRPMAMIPDALSRSQWLSDQEKGDTFANETLPSPLLMLEERDSTHGLSVVAREFVARYTQFGPLLGQRIKEMDIPDDFSMRDVWEVCGATEKFYISTLNMERSNWMRFVRPAPTKDQRNLAALVKGSEIFFVSTCVIEPGSELLFWQEHSTSGWGRKKMEKTNCGGCNLRFSHSLYYRLHCSVFHDPNFSLTIRKYHCKVCGMAVLGKENIMRHAADQHAGKGAYQCQFCKKFFLRLNYLEMHRTYGCAANPQRTRPLCDFCGRKFCQPQKLKVHIKRMHSDMAEVLREFQCKMCLKLLGSRAALQRHLKEVHHKDLVGACTCDRCGKMFQNKSNLKIHMLTHSGVKPFRCKEGSCTAAFTTKQCLQFHYKKVHGFTEESMPKIERCVAYTFDAYSGGAHDEDEKSLRYTPPPIDSPPNSPSPSLPSLDDESNDASSEPLPLPESNSDMTPEDNTAGMSVPSPTPTPPIMRQTSPPPSPEMEHNSRPGGGSVLSKASKKWMGDVIPVQVPLDARMPSPEMSSLKRWPSEALSVESRVESPEPEKKWNVECLPGMRSPDNVTGRRMEMTFGRSMRSGEQEMVDQYASQVRRSPSSLEGEFSPIRRAEPSASLLVEAALDAAERDLSGKLADLKPLVHDPGVSNTVGFLPRMNGVHQQHAEPEPEYGMMSPCGKPPRGIPETGLDMSYKQYETEIVNNADLGAEFRVMRNPVDQQVSFEQEQGLDMSRSSGYPGAGSPYTRYAHADLLPPHLHPHHRAAVAAAGLMYEMEPVSSRCVSPPSSPPPPTSYQAELLRHHWHHLPTSHHTLDLSTARGVQQASPEQSMSPPPPNAYQNYPLSPSPYHAPPPQPRATTPTYHHYSGYY